MCDGIVAAGGECYGSLPFPLLTGGVVAAVEVAASA